MRKLLRPHSPFDIQPDSLIFSDLHLHERKEFEQVDKKTGLNSRLVEGLNILQQIIDILRSHPEIKWVYSLGDLFELKDKVPSHLLIECNKMLSEIEKGEVLHTALLGNHDFNLPKYPIAKLFDLCLITLTQMITRIDGVKIGFIPYERKFEDFLTDLKGINSQNPDIVFFHQEIPGVTYETGREIPGRMDSYFFNPGTLYISGHIHKVQMCGNVQYVGSPYQIRFSDEGQNRFIWVLNSKTKKLAPIKLKYPEFKSLDVRSFPDQWDKATNLEGNYIRVVGDVPTSQWGPEIKNDIRFKLQGAGARGISFQVQIVKQRQSQIPENIIEDDDSIINLYVQNNSEGTDLNIDDLIRTGIEIFKS